MNNSTDEIQELSRGRKLACNITAAGIVLLAGFFLLLCGLNVIPVKVGSAVCGTLLFAVGLIFLSSALISLNSVSLWISFCFNVPALIELLTEVTSAGYARLYPLYIAIPAIASLFTMLFTHEWFLHLRVIALFGVAAALFALQSGGVAGWSVVLPALVIYLGLIMLYIAVKARRKNNDDEY